MHVKLEEETWEGHGGKQETKTCGHGNPYERKHVPRTYEHSKAHVSALGARKRTGPRAVGLMTSRGHQVPGRVPPLHQQRLSHLST